MKISTLLLACGLLSGTVATAQSTLQNGLLAYYPFTANTLDVSGNNRHLFNGGATLTESEDSTPNSAYYFNGTNSYMQLSANAGVNFTGDFTICMKIKPLGYYTGPCHGNALLTKGGNGNSLYRLLLMFDDSYYTKNNNCSTSFVDTAHQNFHIDRVHQGSGHSAGTVPNAPYATFNVWRDLVVMQKGDSLYAYIDGVLIERAYSFPYNNANTLDIFLGKNDNAAYPYFYKGVMDELRFYNRALTPAEVIDYGAYNPLGVAPKTVAETIIMAPNPATNVLKLTNPSSQSVNFQVLNIQGVEVIAGKLKPAENSIPVAQLPMGMYLLHLRQGTGVEVRRFVKQ